MLSTKKHSKAQEKRIDNLIDEMLAIADDSANDLIAVTKGNTEHLTENKELLNRAKLRIDTRKWIIAKLLSDKQSPAAVIPAEGQLHSVPQILVLNPHEASDGI